MEGKHIKTYDVGRYSFEVWEGTDDGGPCYVTVVRSYDREGERGPPSASRVHAKALLTAMQSATLLANRLQQRVKAKQSKQPCTEKPPPTHTLQPSHPTSRLSALDGLRMKTTADAGSAEAASDKYRRPANIRVLSRSHDSLELLITTEEET